MRATQAIIADASVPSPLNRALAKMLPPSPKQNDDYWLAATRDAHVPTASAFGTLVVRDPDDPAQRLHAGRGWQRIHLWATTKGLASHPLNQVQERVDREHTSFRIGYPTADALRSPRRGSPAHLTHEGPP